MVNVRGFVQDTSSLLKTIRLGITQKDKINIACDMLISRIPNFMLRRFSSLTKLEDFTRHVLCENTVFIDDKNLLYKSSEKLNHHICDPKPWEHYFTVKKGDVFLDVGAYVGDSTMKAAHMVGKDGLVIAVEAYLPNYRVLVENMRLNNFTNVLPLFMAAWNCNTTLSLRWGGKGANTMSFKWGEEFGHKILALPLDSILKALNVIPNWIRIDVTGSEFEVLEGLQKTLKRKSPVIVVTCNEEKIKKYMQTLGYVGKRTTRDNAYIFR